MLNKARKVHTRVAQITLPLRWWNRNMPHVLTLSARDYWRGHTGSDWCPCFCPVWAGKHHEAKESCWPCLRQEEPQAPKQGRQGAFFFLLLHYKVLILRGKKWTSSCFKETEIFKVLCVAIACPVSFLYWLRASHILLLDCLSGTLLHLILAMPYHSDSRFSQTAVSPCSTPSQ